MKKLFISLFCLAAFGFTGIAFAQDFACGDSDDAYCVGPDLYEVSLNCSADDGDPSPAFTGGLDVDESGWDLSVDYDPDDQTSPPDPETVCDADGELDLLKTEVKCTEAPNGSNKPDKNKDDGYLQVDFEIKLVEEDAEACVVI